MIRGANLALRFAVELAALAALAVWGAQASSSTPLRIALAVLAPAVAIAIWGRWSAPRAPHRLRGRPLIALELALLAIVCALLAVAGFPAEAAVLAVVAIVNGATLRRQG